LSSEWTMEGEMVDGDQNTRVPRLRLRHKKTCLKMCRDKDQVSIPHNRMVSHKRIQSYKHA